MSEPVWERLRSPDRRPLRVGPVRRERVERLRVVDGELPDHDGATVFDAWRVDDGTVLRAALLRDHDVEPLEIHAASIHIEASDGRLEALLAGAGPVAAAGELERLACACRGIDVDTAYRAIAAGWETADAVKRATRIGFGPCQGRRCVPWLAERLELSPDDPRAQITPRPPLVPVPVSVLAAYAAPLPTQSPPPSADITEVIKRLTPSASAQRERQAQAEASLPDRPPPPSADITEAI